MSKHVTGSVYANNNISNIHIGTTRTSISGVTAANETDPSGARWESREHDIMPRSVTESESVMNCRGIWIENRNGILVKDVNIVMEVGKMSAAIMVDSAADEATIRNTCVHVNIKDALRAIDFDATAVTCKNTSITGYDGCEGVNIRIRGRVRLSLDRSP